ncbi:hypothetical protein FHG87_005138 [Trinorchestia longiramus]|nr:hypothetical protein FHG87_005138 [Trinorchestia longiramus]
MCFVIESTRPEASCLLESYPAGQLVISPPPNFSSDATAGYCPAAAAETEAGAEVRRISGTTGISLQTPGPPAAGGMWCPTEEGTLGAYHVGSPSVGLTSTREDNASVVQLVTVDDAASAADLQDAEAAALPLFTKPPLEDRSKYEKFQNLHDESDDDKEPVTAPGPTSKFSRSAIRRLKNKTVKTTTKIGIDGKPEPVFVCVSDDDSIGSASDLKARINDECDDLGGAGRSVGLGRGGEDASETISSSVYHAECESVTTHEDDPRITGTTDPVSATRRGPKPSRASMRARANAKLEQEKRRASNPDRLLGHEYGEKPLLLDDELDDTGEEEEKVSTDDRTASCKARASSLTIVTDECTSLINLQSPPPPVADVPLQAPVEAAVSPNNQEPEVEDDVFALAPFKNPLQKLGNIFSSHVSISSHLQQVKQFPNRAVSAVTNYSSLNLATSSPDERTESVATEPERKQNLTHVIYEESPSEEFPIYENVTLSKTCPIPESDDFEGVYSRSEANSSVVRSAANNPFINPFYPEVSVSTQALPARGNSNASEIIVSSRSEFGAGNAEISLPVGKDIMSQSVDSLTFKQPIVSSTLSRVSSHSSTDLFGSTPFGCVNYEDKSRANDATKIEFSSPVVDNKPKSSGDVSFSAQVTPKSKQNTCYVPSVEKSPSYLSVTSTPRNNMSNELLENRGLEDEIDDEDLFGSVPFKPILGNSQRSFLNLKSRTLPANMSSSLQIQVQQLGKEETFNTHTEIFKSSAKSGKKITPPTFRKPRLTHQILSSESESSTDSIGSSSSLAVGTSSKKSKNRDRSKDRLKYKNISEEFEEENTMVLPLKQFSLSKKDKQFKKIKKQDKPEKLDKKQEKLEKKLEKAEKKSEKAEKKSEKAEKKLEKQEKKAEKADKKIDKAEKKNEKGDKKSEKISKSEKKVDKAQTYEAAGISNMSFEDQSVEDYRSRGGVGAGPDTRNAPSSPDDEGGDLRTSAGNRFGSLKRGINPFSKLSNRI